MFIILLVILKGHKSMWVEESCTQITPLENMAWPCSM